MQRQWTFFWFNCDVWQKVDFTWQLEMTSSVVVLRSSKFFPKPNLHPKNVMITVWWSAAALIHYCFLNPSETIIDVYSANLWNSLQTESPTASTDQHKGPSSSPWQHPTTCCTTNDSKLNKLGCEIWLHMCYSLDLLSMNYHFFKHLDKFLRGKCFHNQQEEENAFQEFIEFWSMDFYLTGINKLISPWQKCVDCNGSYLINEDVFEPSYNDLKFMVPNHNYICTNLM